MFCIGGTRFLCSLVLADGDLASVACCTQKYPSSSVNANRSRETVQLAGRWELTVSGQHDDILGNRQCRPCP